MSPAMGPLAIECARLHESLRETKDDGRDGKVRVDGAPYEEERLYGLALAPQNCMGAPVETEFVPQLCWDGA